MPYLFYTNKETIEHNSKIFCQNTSQTYMLEAIDIQHCALPSTYQLQIDLSKVACLDRIVQMKIEMLVSNFVLEII